MTTPAMPPPSGPSEAGDLAAMSRRFVAHGGDELAKGDSIQASEKVWGAANYALKAVAAQRGWRHRGHRNVFATAGQLAEETGRPDLYSALIVARGIHYNFYDNDLTEHEVSMGIDVVEKYVAELDEIRASPPQPFLVSNAEDQRRLERLTGKTYSLGTRSDDGFVQPRASNAGRDAGEGTMATMVYEVQNGIR